MFFNVLRKNPTENLARPKTNQCGQIPAQFGGLYHLIQVWDQANHQGAKVASMREVTEQMPSGGIKMLNFIKNFRRDEDGAVTVDFVVLTAAIVGLGIAVMTSVGSGTTALGDTISGDLAGMTTMSH